MSVRPPASITVAFSGAATSLPTFSILLPTTRTDVGADNLADLPSNTFAFLNRVALGCFASTFAAGFDPSRSCFLGGATEPSGEARRLRSPRAPPAASTNAIRVVDLPILFPQCIASASAPQLPRRCLADRRQAPWHGTGQCTQGAPVGRTTLPVTRFQRDGQPGVEAGNRAALRRRASQELTCKVRRRTPLAASTNAIRVVDLPI